MAKDPTYEELEKKVRKLEQMVVTFSQAKQSLKESLEKQEGLSNTSAEPEMAVEVLNQRDAARQPIEQALIVEHIFRKTIEESIPAGIFGISPQGRQIYVNRGFCEMVGWTEAQLLNAAYPFAFWPRHMIEGVVPDFGALTEAVLSSSGIELPFKRKNGEQFWGLVTGTELNDSRGQSVGFLMSVADISSQKRAENAMRQLSSRLVNRQESERKFVARELHDGISGKLAAVKYSIEKIISEIRPKKDPLKASLQDVLSIVHDAIDETQRIYRNLHPAILDDLGLHAALKSLCREFMEVYETTVVESHFEVPQYRIQDPLKILIYRIAQEALTNVAKHSQADRVEISLKLVENKVDLVIKDNGKGFDIAKAQAMDVQDRGLGLENIKERTIIFGGTLEIQTAPGKGTVIRVSWPL